MNRDDREPVIMAGKMRRMVFKEFAFRRDMGQPVSTAHRTPLSTGTVPSCRLIKNGFQPHRFWESFIGRDGYCLAPEYKRS